MKRFIAIFAALTFVAGLVPVRAEQNTATPVESQIPSKVSVPDIKTPTVSLTETKTKIQEQKTAINKIKDEKKQELGAIKQDMQQKADKVITEKKKAIKEGGNNIEKKKEAMKKEMKDVKDQKKVEAKKIIDDKKDKLNQLKEGLK